MPTTSPPNDSDVLASPAERNQPIAVNKHAQVLYGRGLWNTGTATWATLPQRGSLGGIDNDAGEVSTITWPALIYTALNDEGDVVGHSDWSDSWFMEIFTIGMVWKTDGTGMDKYKTPDYFMRSKSVNNQPYDTLGVAMISAIADDGTVNCATENIEDWEWLHYDSVAGGNLVTVAETVDRWASSGQNYLSGDILDKNRSLALKFDGSQSWKLLLREDGEQEVGSGIAEELDLSSPYYYAESNYGFTSSISLAPNPLDLKQDQTEPGERLWLSLYPRSKNSQVYLEKRVGGTGPARWHNPPSMAQGAKRLNARGEAITDTHLWRNGKYELLNDIVSKPDALTIDKAIDLSSNGIILVQATEEGTQKTGLLLPVELITDLNNDGEINSADNALRDAALESGATDEVKDKGTEFLFVNDKISNGLGDVEDKKAPAGTTDDDDIQEIKVTVGMKSGTIRFDHPAIAKLKFFEDKPCATEVTFPFDLKVKELPETLYIRTEGDFDGQEEGDLVLKYKPKADGEEIEAVKLKLTIVHRVGDKKYFHATRDYMKEFNSKLCVRQEKTNKGGGRFGYWRLVTMLHESTRMKTVDTFHRNPQLKGIGAVVGSFGGYDVAVNGNYCYASSPALLGRLAGRRIPKAKGMTDRCHGTFVSGRAKKFFGTIGGSSPFEKASADYIGYNAQNKIDIRTGFVPTAPVVHDEALGGFASKLENYGWHPWYGIGEAGNEKVFFVAMPYVVHNPGGGGPVDFKNRLKESGVPALPGGQAGEIQCIAGDGGSSLGLAYRLDAEPLQVRTEGTKHRVTGGRFQRQQGDYFINTYLLFSTQKTR